MVDENQDLGPDQGRDYIEIKIPSQEDSVPPKREVEPVEEKVSVAEKSEGSAPAQPVAKPVVKKKVAKKKSAKKKKRTTKKKAVKKTTASPVVKPKKQKRRKQADYSWLWALLLIIGLILIAGVIYLSFNPEVVDKVRSKSTMDDGNAPSSEADRVAALVGGQPIYISAIDAIYNQLPDQYRGQTSKELILEQLIDQEVLLQEAEKQGIDVSDSDIDAFLSKFKLMNGLDDDSFEAALKERNLDLDEFKGEVKKQLLITKLLNETVLSDLKVSDEEVVAYYNNNSEFFKVPEAGVLRHILITPEENESDEEFRARAESIKDLINDDFSNFCDLVTEYSQDPGSISTCGEYIVAKDGRFVPEFEEAAFSMDVNDTEIVKTTFGYHIIWKVAHREAGVRPLEEVRSQIEELLKQELSNKAVMDYVSSLREQTTIEKYPLDEQATETAPAPAKEEEVAEEEMKVEVEPTKPARESNFGRCLAEKGVTLYGVYWSPDVSSQREMLGDALDQITYVECDPQEGDAPSECSDIYVYPTWRIGSGEDATLLVGKQSINALELATGCSA